MASLLNRMTLNLNGTSLNWKSEEDIQLFNDMFSQVANGCRIVDSLILKKGADKITKEDIKELKAQLKGLGITEAKLEPYVLKYDIHCDGENNVTFNLEKDDALQILLYSIGRLYYFVLSRRKRAENQHALIEFPDHQATITDPNYKYAFSPIENDGAFILPLKERFSITTPLRIADIIEKFDENVIGVDQGLISQIFTAIKENIMPEYDTPTSSTIYLPTFYKSMGIDYSHTKLQKLEDKKKKSNENIIQEEIKVDLSEEEIKKAKKKESREEESIIKRLEAIEKCAGVIGGVVYPLIVVESCNLNDNTMTISSPYMKTLLGKLDDNRQPIKRGKEELTKPQCSYVVHSTIASERNKVAQEIVYSIVRLIETRGATPTPKTRRNKSKTYSEGDSKVISCHKTFRGIVEETSLRKKLDETVSTSDKNKLLKRAFAKAYELLKTKTDLYDKYIDLNIPNIIPTYRTLDLSLEITHKGIKG